MAAIRRFTSGVLAVSLIGTALSDVHASETVNHSHPDIVSVKVSAETESKFGFAVTLCSPYDTAARYADAFRVVAKNGAVFGERVLLHDHADEQPFTRDISGVKIPSGVQHVTVQGRDQKFGYGGKFIEVILPGR